MKARNIEDRLAQLAALIVLFGVTFATGDALADDENEVTTTAVAIHKAGCATLESAEQANHEAAAQAVASLTLDHWVDLDINLEDRTSTMIAGRRKAH